MMIRAAGCKPLFAISRDKTEYPPPARALARPLRALAGKRQRAAMLA